jgi:hypothetical protein
MRRIIGPRSRRRVAWLVAVLALAAGTSVGLTRAFADAAPPDGWDAQDWAALAPDEQAAEIQDTPDGNTQPPAQVQDDAQANAELDQMAQADGPGAAGPTGIIEAAQSPFSSEQYLIENQWAGDSPDGQNSIAVYAGAYASDPQQGVLVVDTLPAGSTDLVGDTAEYPTPTQTGAASIVRVDGQSIYFVTDGSETWLLNLATRQFDRPPDCSTVVPSAGALWPPNHKLQPVSLAGATDPDGDTVTLTVTDVTQDEPLQGSGDGNRSPDAQLTSTSSTVLLRAERSGGGDGRVYRIAFRGDDGRGGTCTGTVDVGVPHDAHATANDSGQTFNSLG